VRPPAAATHWHRPPAPAPPLHACRFASGEYLDAAFLTKLMCVGRELHDFLTLPAQVHSVGSAANQRPCVCVCVWYVWGVLTPWVCMLALTCHCLRSPPFRSLHHPLQDILIAMGK
jgi:hypothetical protein